MHKGQIAFLADKWHQINLETSFLAQNTHMGGGKDVTLGTLTFVYSVSTKNCFLAAILLQINLETSFLAH